MSHIPPFFHFEQETFSNITVQRVGLLLRIREVHVSNLAAESGRFDKIS
jgi:hypothetical protein